MNVNITWQNYLHEILERSYNTFERSQYQVKSSLTLPESLQQKVYSVYMCKNLSLKSSNVMTRALAIKLFHMALDYSVFYYFYTVIPLT